MQRLIGMVTFNYMSGEEILYSPTAKLYLKGNKNLFRLKLSIPRDTEDMSFKDDEWNKFMDYAKSNNIKMFNRSFYVKEVSDMSWKFWAFITSVITNSNNSLPISYSANSLHNAYSVFCYAHIKDISDSLQAEIKDFALYKVDEDNDNLAYIDGIIESDLVIYESKITEFFL